MRTNMSVALAVAAALSWSGVSLAAGSVAASDDDIMEGTVVKTDGRVLYLRMRGAVIPVHVTARTHFEGARHQLTQFAQGEQVRVALRPDSQTLNEARSVMLSDNAQEGVGGSGPAQPPLQPGPKAGAPNQGVMDAKPPEAKPQAAAGPGTPSGMMGQPQSASVPVGSGTPSGMLGQPQNAAGAGAPKP